MHVDSSWYPDLFFGEWERARRRMEPGCVWKEWEFGGLAGRHWAYRERLALTLMSEVGSCVGKLVAVRRASGQREDHALCALQPSGWRYPIGWRRGAFIG